MKKLQEELKEWELFMKGQHVIRVIETLRDMLLRSGGQHVKKRYTFRPLAIARGFTERQHHQHTILRCFLLQEPASKMGQVLTD